MQISVRKKVTTNLSVYEVTIFKLTGTEHYAVDCLNMQTGALIRIGSWKEAGLGDASTRMAETSERVLQDTLLTLKTRDGEIRSVTALPCPATDKS